MIFIDYEKADEMSTYKGTMRVLDKKWITMVYIDVTRNKYIGAVTMFYFLSIKNIYYWRGLEAEATPILPLILGLL